MIVVFYIFAGLLVLLSIQSLRGGFKFLDYCRRPAGTKTSNNLPFATVIVPCRGLDDELSQNLASLYEFDHPDYEIVFVVDDANDPATAVIGDLIRNNDKPETRLVIAQKATDSSQKVENLREAVLHASDRSQAFVFFDSDARPSPGSLKHLLAALEPETTGAATGYRWFISKQPTFATELRSAWNASIASALGPNTKSNFCWGGAMAIRRDKFEDLKIRDRWSGTLSDDFTVTRAMNDAGLDIVFVPNALTTSVGNCSFAGMIEFTTRQMKITRVYATKLWILSFIGSSLFCGVMLATILILVLAEPLSHSFFAALGTLLSVSICSTGKAWLRLKAVVHLLPDHKKDLERQFWSQNILWALTPVVFLFNSVAAAISRRVIWRGTIYELKSPSETVIIAD